MDVKHSACVHDGLKMFELNMVDTQCVWIGEEYDTFVVGLA